MSALIRRLSKVGGKQGFTLMEIIVVLAVIGILAAVLAPMILNYLEDTKKSKAENDVKTIAGVVLRLTRDVGHFPLFKDGTRTTGAPDIELLRGPGNDPIDHDTKKWLTGLVSELEDHVVKNNPGVKKYAPDGRFPWRGSYIEKISEDPWGNRYLVNIKNSNPLNKPDKVVWALSAGSNGKIETDPDVNADSGPAPGGDDIAVRIK